MIKLVGVKIITVKSSGNKGYMYYFIGDFSDYEKKNAEVYGNSVFSEYSSKLFNVSVGDEVDIVYSKGYQDKAQLMDILVVTDSKEKISK